jgi:hypothetical protein
MWATLAGQLARGGRSVLGPRIIPRDVYTLCDDEHTTNHTVCMIDKGTKHAGQPTRAGCLSYEGFLMSMVAAVSRRALLVSQVGGVGWGPGDLGPGDRYGEAACWRLS